METFFMKPKLKLWFVDFHKGWDICNNLFTRLLSQRYDVELTDDPDLLIFLPFGSRNLNYRCRKVFITGENLHPDFNICDYAFTFEHLDDPRNYRFPLGLWSNLQQGADWDPEQELAKKTKFCGFLYSNPSCQIRNDLFEKLSRYQRVDAGGRCKNNLGYRVKEKIPFLSQYKFSFAFENCSSPGYTTEKIADAFQANTLPLYWGNPTIHLDFNPGSFLNYDDYGSNEALVERIIELDQNDDLYLQYMRQPRYPNNEFPQAARPENLLAQFEKIVNSTDPPVSQKPRRWIHGMQYIARQQKETWRRRLQRWKYRVLHRLSAA